MLEMVNEILRIDIGNGITVPWRAIQYDFQKLLNTNTERAKNTTQIPMNSINLNIKFFDFCFGDCSTFKLS